MTVAERFLSHLRHQKRSSPHSLLAAQNDLKQFEAFLEKEFPQTTLLSAEYEDIRAWIVWLMEQKFKERSINRKIHSLKSFYRYLLTQKLIDSLPTAKVRTLKTPKLLPKFVREDEMQHLLENEFFTHDWKGLRNRLVLELLYGTGLRCSELINLKINDLSFGNNTLKVEGKRGKERLIPFGETLALYLKSYLALRPQKTPYLLITNTLKPCYPSFIYLTVRKYLTYTSSDKKSPHVLRHTYATHLLNEGADLNAIKELLGHSNLSATQMYTHNSIDRLKKVFEQAHPKS